MEIVQQFGFVSPRVEIRVRPDPAHRVDELKDSLVEGQVIA
jgi:hypothetical protein